MVSGQVQLPLPGLRAGTVHPRSWSASTRSAHRVGRFRVVIQTLRCPVSRDGAHLEADSELRKHIGRRLYHQQFEIAAHEDVDTGTGWVSDMVAMLEQKRGIADSGPGGGWMRAAIASNEPTVPCSWFCP